MRVAMRGVAAAVLTLGLYGGAAAGEDLSVHDPWVAETPPGAMAAAAFMELRNAGAEPITVVRVSSRLAQQGEFHRTVMDDDMARMERQSEVLVPAAGRLVMEPGGLHVMLLEPKALKIGDTVPLVLELGDGERIEVSAPVRSRSGGGHDHHHHH